VRGPGQEQRGWAPIRVPALTALVLASAAATGCGDPLVERENIVDTRVLGARVEVAGEPSRAAPAPGESATVRWLVVDPAEPQPRSWTLAACLSAPTNTGIARCEHVVAQQSGADDGTVVPTLDWLTPETTTGPMAIVGTVCTGGAVVRHGAWPNWGCDAAATKTTLMSLDVLVQTDEATNRNPSAQDDRLTLGGDAWLAPVSPAPAGPCASLEPSPELPHVSGGADRAIRYTFVGDDRETLGEERESLLLAHFVTGGELERPFSVVEAGDDRPEPVVDLDWTAPSGGDEGRSVRFYFVSRDRRGGADWTMRQVCVIP